MDAEQFEPFSAPNMRTFAVVGLGLVVALLSTMLMVTSLPRPSVWVSIQDIRPLDMRLGECLNCMDFNTVGVMSDGRLLWNGKRIDEAKLKQYVGETLEFTPTPRLRLDFDARTPYPRIVEVMWMLGKFPVQRLEVSTNNPNLHVVEAD